MAVERDRPYQQFNFLVDLGTGSTNDAQAGFMECSDLGMDVAVVEYRAGNMLENAPQKLTGLSRVQDVTLKRGVIGALDLYSWLDSIRTGDVNAARDVTIQQQSEDHAQVVMTWILRRARIVRYRSGPLNARSSEVAVEEITLSAEWLEMQ